MKNVGNMNPLNFSGEGITIYLAVAHTFVKHLIFVPDLVSNETCSGK